MEFCSVHSWTCPWSWKRHRPCLLPLGRWTLWHCWQWPGQRWLLLALPVLPCDFQSCWCRAAGQMLARKKSWKRGELSELGAAKPRRNMSKTPTRPGVCVCTCWLSLSKHHEHNKLSLGHAIFKKQNDLRFCPMLLPSHILVSPYKPQQQLPFGDKSCLQQERAVVSSLCGQLWRASESCYSQVIQTGC